ncbi:unnamed protein product [Paramecium primaurelia]|uniref:Transmembrane protein n=1 Tax=Paramecium primaurelia TaxID=5886 RepID=A0A8S1PLA5_PARPR|nr:unnamed protein product [Paramecium primaurelia]
MSSQTHQSDKTLQRDSPKNSYLSTLTAFSIILGFAILIGVGLENQQMIQQFQFQSQSLILLNPFIWFTHNSLARLCSLCCPQSVLKRKLKKKNSYLIRCTYLNECLMCLLTWKTQKRKYDHAFWFQIQSSQLFLDNTYIKFIKSNSFQSANEDVIMCMIQTDIYNDFIKLLSPSQQQAIEYQHSKEHASIQFLVVREDQQKNKELKEQDIYDEIEALISISNKQYQKQIILEDSKKQEIGKEQILKEKFYLFEKLIYLYTRDEIFQVFNWQFAQHNYQKIKNIILCLYQRFKQNQLKQYKIFLSFFRGIYFDSKDIFDKLSKIHNLHKRMEHLFWNTITSAYYNFCSNGNYGIFYQLLLDQDVPHPCFKLQLYHTHYPEEEEVLLFPQFEFIVQETNSIQLEPTTIYTVTIKQVTMHFHFIQY